MAALGVEVRRGVALTSFEQDPDFVRVDLGDGRSERAGWLIGTDGGRSAVRRLAGFAFPGTGPQITGHQALAELEDTGGLQFGWHATPTGVYAFGPVPGRILTVEFDGPPADRETPVDAAELERSIRNVTGTPAGLLDSYTTERHSVGAAVLD